MSELDIFTFKKYIINELVREYNLAESEANLAFRQSVVNKMLATSPEFIMHYSIQNNAEEIYKQYMGIPIEM